MDRRAHFRAKYGKGWESMDAEIMLSAVADNFVLDDPAMPEPVTKATLTAYLAGWNERTKAAGATGQMEISDIVVQDKDGIRLEWNWWRFPGTDIEGAGLLKVTDDGVVAERVAYYVYPDRHMQSPD